MTTDVINGVPRSLLERCATLSHDAMGLDFEEHAAIERKLRALLATAQPVSAGENLIRFDFTNAEGQPDSKMMSHDEMRQRYSDLLISNALALGGGLVCAGGAEVQESADEAFREWERDGNPISGANGYMAAKAGFRAGAEWQARAAQHRQAVAVTDEVRALLQRAKGVLEEVWEFSYEHGAASALSARDMAEEIDAALAARKTGEEE